MKTAKYVTVTTQRDLKVGSIQTVFAEIVGSTKGENAKYKVSSKKVLNAREYRYRMTRVD